MHKTKKANAKVDQYYSGYYQTLLEILLAISELKIPFSFAHFHLAGNKCI